MYSILIKYTSTSKKTFWYDYELDGTSTRFETLDDEVLEAELDKLDKKYGYENLRVVNNVPFSVAHDLKDIIEFATEPEVRDVYATAYTKIFGEGGG